jgi:hypothetical protein
VPFLPQNEHDESRAGDTSFVVPDELSGVTVEMLRGKPMNRPDGWKCDGRICESLEAWRARSLSAMQA